MQPALRYQGSKFPTGDEVIVNGPSLGHCDPAEVVPAKPHVILPVIGIVVALMERDLQETEVNVKSGVSGCILAQRLH